jgi:uncharacterized Rmd1/YagE family protein
LLVAATVYNGDVVVANSSSNNNNNIPEIVINVNGTTIVWDAPVITDRTILANRSDIQGDSFGTRPKKMRISQRLFIRF